MIQRRGLARLAAAIAFTLAAAGAAAQDWPAKPVRILTGFPPGAATDLLGRILGDHLGKTLGQPFVVDARPGAGGVVAGQALIAAPADGHTLYLANSGIVATAKALFDMTYNPATAFVPITVLARTALVLEVAADLPVTSLPELVAYAKANPGKLNHGTPGSGTVMHLASELLRQRLGIDSQRIPYRGVAPYAQGLAQREFHWGVDASIGALNLQKAGHARLLAVTTAERWPSFPDVPSLTELGVPDSAWPNWLGLVAAAGTPQPIVDRIAAETARGWRDPEIAQRIRNSGFEPWTMTPGETARFFDAERARWTKVIRDNNIKAE